MTSKSTLESKFQSSYSNQHESDSKLQSNKSISQSKSKSKAKKKCKESKIEKSIVMFIHFVLGLFFYLLYSYLFSKFSKKNIKLPITKFKLHKKYKISDIFVLDIISFISGWLIKFGVLSLILHITPSKKQHKKARYIFVVLVIISIIFGNNIWITVSHYLFSKYYKPIINFKNSKTLKRFQYSLLLSNITVLTLDMIYNTIVHKFELFGHVPD